tara:strand:+ start:2564 stop:4363 length:1800 start_codon:yes stop_codon:yes gene_type:complete
MVLIDINNEYQLELDVSQATPEERIGIQEVSVQNKRGKKIKVPLMHLREVDRCIRKYGGKITISDESRESYEEWVKELQKIEQIKKDIEKYKLPEKFAKHIKRPPYDYQLTDFLYFLKKKKGLLLYTVGLGKTLIGILLSTYLYRFKNAKNILYLCPAHLKYQTRDEFLNFSDLTPILLDEQVKTYKCPLYPEHLFELKDKKCIACNEFKTCKQKSRRAYKTRRADHLMNDEGVFIANYELMRTRPDLFTLHKHWDLICFDEFSRIKAWDVNATVRAFKELKTTYAILASATPIENRLEDLYNAVTFCNPDILGNKASFVRTHCELNEWHKIDPNHYRNIALFRKKISTISVRRTVEDVLDSLPPHPIYINNVAELKGAQKKLYRALTGRDQYSMVKDNYTATKGLSMKLRRLCNWSGMIDDTTDDSGKLDILQDLLINIDSQCIIYSEWADMVVKIKDFIGPKAICIFGQQSSTGKSMNAKQKNECIGKFKNGEYKYLVATNCIKDGVNLQNVQHLINFELPWNPAILQQRIGRLRWHRQENHQCIIHNIFTKGTFEDRVRQLIFSKGDLFEAIIDKMGEFNNKLSNTKQLHKLIFET